MGRRVSQISLQPSQQEAKKQRKKDGDIPGEEDIEGCNNRRRTPERGLSGKHRPIGRSDKIKQFIGPIDSNVSDPSDSE